MTQVKKVTSAAIERQLEQAGIETLSDFEILFYILNQHLKVSESRQFCQKFFHNFSSLSQLNEFSKQDLAQLGDKKASNLLQICLAFGKKSRQTTFLKPGKVCSSLEIGAYMSDKYGGYKQEVLVGVFLDTKNQLIAQKELFLGTLNSATVHPREVFKFAVKFSSSKVMIVHNHPSGDVTPSKNDLNLTKRLAKCGEILGIPLLDHIIVSSQGYLSFREERLIK
ncbi:DNA repair protein RadC [Ligilactobacillus sp. WC1T17]|uniref:DNA repair protein RadC n=1 Tax=Ligilactobacillus ruminis TaxID=1623 RepID=A0ABY1AAU0_9LACO|nr:DNA repair protein RadC [Ligilactobacillus ruminis]